MYISNHEELVGFCDRARSERILAVDTEFLREKTFFPKLCLIQLATPVESAAIDPLAIDDLSCVAELLEDTSITKVLHACSQDLDAIDHALSCRVTPLFDTQLAAAFLGHRMQMGYGALVEAYTGVHLPKAASLTDWSRRPLDPEQLEYAEDDVRYLPGIYERMVNDLVARDRLGWVQPEMLAIANPPALDRDPMHAYARLKRMSSLTRRQLGIAREVCAWRERRAAERDIPRKWVLSDEVIVEVCKLAPGDERRLRRVRGTEQLSGTDASAIVEAVARGRACPDDELPKAERHTRPSAELECVVDLMYALVRRVSETSGVAVQLIATRDDLYAFATNRSMSRVSSGWRRELVGTQLDRLLAGDLGLTVKDGHIEVL